LVNGVAIVCPSAWRRRWRRRPVRPTQPPVHWVDGGFRGGGRLVDGPGAGWLPRDGGDGNSYRPRRVSKARVAHTGMEIGDPL